MGGKKGGKLEFLYRDKKERGDRNRLGPVVIEDKSTLTSPLSNAPSTSGRNRGPFPRGNGPFRVKAHHVRVRHMIPQNQSSLQIGVPDQVSRKTDPLSTRGIFNLPRVHVSTSPLSNYTREDNAITRGVVVVVVVGANGSLYTHVHTYIACKKVAALTLSPPRPLSPRLESDHRR